MSNITEKFPSRQLSELRAPDVQTYLESKDTIIIPVGSNEQHGQHLPLGTDTITGYEISRRAAALADVLYTPAVWTGYSPAHMWEVGDDGAPKGRGTVTLRSSTMQSLLIDIGHSLVHHGFNRLVFVNGHHSNEHIIDPVIRHLRYTTGALVCFIQPVMMNGTPLVDEIFAEDSKETLPGWHASVLETSQVLAYNSDLVRMDAAEPAKISTPEFLPGSFHPSATSPSLQFEELGFFKFPFDYRDLSNTGGNGDARNATAEKGEASFNAFAEHIARGIAELEKAKVEVHHREFVDRAF